jgi:hypothetical protein
MIIEKRGGTPQIPEGEYEAELESVTEEIATFSGGDTYPYVRFRFSLLDQNYFGVKVDASVPNNFSPGTKLESLLKGFGIDVNKASSIDTDSLIGARVKVLVEHVTTKKGLKYANVTKVLPLRKNPNPKPPMNSDLKDNIPF